MPISALDKEKVGLLGFIWAYFTPKRPAHPTRIEKAQTSSPSSPRKFKVLLLYDTISFETKQNTDLSIW